MLELLFVKKENTGAIKISDYKMNWKYIFCKNCKRETYHFIRENKFKCNICGKFKEIENMCDSVTNEELEIINNIKSLEEDEKDGLC